MYIINIALFNVLSVLYSYSLLTVMLVDGKTMCLAIYSYLNVLFRVNNIHINLCCRCVMNVSGGTIYSMYKQEKYVNKKLDPQKKSVHSI